MPRGNKTGPNEQGSKTGRGMGYCAGFNMPGFMNSSLGRGLGRGRGFAWRSRTMPVQQTQQIEITEKQYLEQELEVLKQEMKEMEKRLKELKK
ncbi:DUF5320 domain-containing protein [archaeon]|nr:DUF5320 domain-containing protein [archaeon]